MARELIVQNSSIELEDKVYRSYGILANSRLIQSAEAANCLSDLRLGIDLGYIQGISRNILTELMVLTQPHFTTICRRTFRPRRKRLSKSNLNP